LITQLVLATNPHERADEDPMVSALRDLVTERYRELRTHKDFTTAADQARIEVFSDYVWDCLAGELGE